MQVVIYSLVDSFSYGLSFLCIGLIFALLRLSEKIPKANALSTHAVTVSKIKSHFLKKEGGVFP